MSSEPADLTTGETTRTPPAYLASEDDQSPIDPAEENSYMHDHPSQVREADLTHDPRIL